MHSLLKKTYIYIYISLSLFIYIYRNTHTSNHFFALVWDLFQSGADVSPSRAKEISFKHVKLGKIQRITCHAPNLGFFGTIVGNLRTSFLLFFGMRDDGNRNFCWPLQYFVALLTYVEMVFSFMSLPRLIVEGRDCWPSAGNRLIFKNWFQYFLHKPQRKHTKILGKTLN